MHVLFLYTNLLILRKICLLFLYVFVHSHVCDSMLHVCRHACVLQHACGGYRIIFGSRFFPSTFVRQGLSYFLAYLRLTGL